MKRMMFKNRVPEMTAEQIAEEATDAALRRELTALDRCDVCGARAWVRAVMKTSELLFCGHHAAEHITALQETALYVQDDREELVASN